MNALEGASFPIPMSNPSPMLYDGHPRVEGGDGSWKILYVPDALIEE